uniref:DNA repair protein RAD51 homolog 4 isoform X1 n=3 Tax=Rhizophora mucronata TaxID=61149 RepID=A0A2P2LSY2_RHIMU
MSALKSLERYYPILDSHFQSFCASHGIFTAEDFLTHDLYVLAASAEQQPTAERLKEGIAQVLSIIDEWHRPWLNGMELLEDAERNKHVLSTGIEGIDLILGGGLCQGQLTEVVGTSSSGKTQVCLRMAANVAKNHTGKVIYIDTGNSFSPQRIESFVARNSDPIYIQARSNIIQKVMSNIVYHSVFDIFAMFDVLHQLENNLTSQVLKEDCKVLLLIIDSISSLITPVLGGSGSQGHALMTTAGVLLKKLAHEHNIVLLVTNHMVGGEGSNLKPALGETWKSIPHVRLRLSRNNGSNVCNLSVLKHPAIASSLAATFTID